MLESALDDVEGDLKGRRGAEDYKRAFQHLYAAAAPLRDAGGGAGGPAVPEARADGPGGAGQAAEAASVERP